VNLLVATLIAWIAIHAGLQAPEPPRIVQVRAEQIAAMTDNTANPEAVYVYDERTIYFPNTWSSDNLRDRATLVHELAHHVLKMNNVRAPCERAYEAEAYRLEFEWLREQGITDPYKFLDTNALAIILRSACRD